MQLRRLGRSCSFFHSLLELLGYERVLLPNRLLLRLEGDLSGHLPWLLHDRAQLPVRDLGALKAPDGGGRDGGAPVPPRPPPRAGNAGAIADALIGPAFLEALNTLNRQNEPTLNILNILR